MRLPAGGRRGDVGRLSDLLARAGMDTRIWVSYAIVDDDENAISIEEGGVFVDVTLQPSGRALTVRLGSAYAADGGTVFYPIRRKDELVVLISEGDEHEGPVAVLRLHNEVDRFPLSVNGRDVDGEFAFFVLEAGDWEVEVAGEVHLQGGADAPGAARVDDAVEVAPSDPVANPAWQTWLAAVGTATGAGPPPPDSIKGAITAGSSKVKIGG